MSSRESPRSIPRPSRMLAQAAGARPRTSIGTPLPSRPPSAGCPVNCCCCDSGPSSLGSDGGAGCVERGATAAPVAASDLSAGARVLVNGNMRGVIRFVGSIPGAVGTWCGVELDDAIGKNDGEKNGRRYFHCAPNHGMFVPMAKISPVSPASPSSAGGNTLFGRTTLLRAPPVVALTSPTQTTPPPPPPSRSFSKELRIEDYLESKCKAKESRKGSLQKFNEHASPKTLQRSLILRNQFRDEPCPSEEEEEEEDEVYENDEQAQQDYGADMVRRSLGAGSTAPISLRDRKQITASLSFGLQKLVQRQATSSRSKGEDGGGGNAQRDLVMPSGVVAFQQQQQQQQLQQRDDAEVVAIAAGTGTVTSGTASSNNDSSLSPIPEREDDVGSPIPVVDGESTSSVIVTIQEKAANLLEPTAVSQDVSLSPIQELQDENEESNLACSVPRTNELRDIRVMVPCSSSAGATIELLSDENRDLSLPKPESVLSDNMSCRLEFDLAGSASSDAEVYETEDGSAGPASLFTPEDTQFRVSDSVFDMIMCSLRENVLQQDVQSHFYHRRDSSAPPGDHASDGCSSLESHVRRPRSADTDLQGECRDLCDLTADCASGGSGGNGSAAAAAAAAAEAAMKQSVCSQDSGVVCDTAGPSSLQRSSSMQQADILITEHNEQEDLPRALESRNSDNMPCPEADSSIHGETAYADAGASTTAAHVSDADADLSEAAGLSTSEATENTATAGDEDDVSSAAAAGGCGSARATSGGLSRAAGGSARRTPAVASPTASVGPESPATGASAVTRTPPRSRSSLLATPARKPNINVGSRIKAMLQESCNGASGSAAGGTAERKPRPQRKNKWDEVEKKIQQNLQEKKKAKTEVKSRINSNLAGAREAARRSPRVSLYALWPGARPAEPSLCGGESLEQSLPANGESEAVATVGSIAAVAAHDGAQLLLTPKATDSPGAPALAGPTASICSRPESRVSKVVVPVVPPKPTPSKRDYSRPWAEPPLKRLLSV